MTRLHGGWAPGERERRYREVFDAPARLNRPGGHVRAGAAVAQVNQVMTDPSRIERIHPKHQTHEVTGVTATGRWPYIAYELRPSGDRYPIHARPAQRRNP